MKNLAEINPNRYYVIWRNKIANLYVDIEQVDRTKAKALDNRAKEVYIVFVVDARTYLKAKAGYVSIYRHKAVFWNEVDHDTMYFIDLNGIIPTLKFEFSDILSAAQMEFDYINASDLAIIFRDPLHKSPCLFGQFDCITLTDVLDD